MKKRLRSLKKMSQKKLQGFTLIELMIAMALIAILATAGIQAYTGYVKKGRDTARIQIASNLNTAVMSYAASHGGNPPASPTAFDEFLATSGESFGGGSTLTIEDPAGGKNVCLDAEGTANQPCSFNYTAYDDGTYAISYGVEHKSSTEGNFYKTTDSVLDPDSTDINTATVVPKYGVYIGSAKYIGKNPTTQNQDSNYPTDQDGVDETYIPPGNTVIRPLVPILRRLRVDTPTVPSGGGTPPVVLKAFGETCTSGTECSTSYCGMGYYDTVGTCTYGLHGDICNADNQCYDDNCWIGTGTCYTCPVLLKYPGVACTANSECISGTCSGGICGLNANNQSCSSGAQCQNGFCGFTGIMPSPGPCMINSTGYICTNGGTGATCGNDIQCQSGFYCNIADEWMNFGECAPIPIPKG